MARPGHAAAGQGSKAIKATTPTKTAWLSRNPRDQKRRVDFSLPAEECHYEDLQDRDVSNEPWSRPLVQHSGGNVVDFRSLKAMNAKKPDGAPSPYRKKSRVITSDAADAERTAAAQAARQLRCRERDGIPLARTSDFVAPDQGQGLILHIDSQRAGAFRAFAVKSGAGANVIGKNHLTEHEKARIF